MSKQIDYTNGKIYKVVSNDYKMTYIGSTAQVRLCDRMSGHRQKYKSWKEGKYKKKVSIFDIFDIYGVENCKIELIEEYACNSKNDLERKEGDFIKNTDCVNKIVAGRTDKEYREDNKEEIKIKNKEYKERNKEEIKVKNKIYKQENKEEILAKQKKYYEANKDKIKEKVECPCGSVVVRNHLSRHNKSIKHQDWERRESK
jgi:ribosomal protein S27AE